MFSLQIGSLLTCRDECALEFALKVDRDAGGNYLGGTGGSVLGPRHVFVSASDPVTVSLESLEKARENPLKEGETVLSCVQDETSRKTLPSSSGAFGNSEKKLSEISTPQLPWSSASSFLATLAATSASSSSASAGDGAKGAHESILSHLNKKPSNWMPCLKKCDWTRRNNMKADIEEAMGIDGVSFATYDQLKYGAGLGPKDDDGGGGAGGAAGKKATPAVKRTAPKRQRNSTKMIRKAEKDRAESNKKKRQTVGGKRTRRRAGESDDTSSEGSYDTSDSSSGSERGIYSEGVGGGSLLLVSDSDDGSGSVVEFSDGMQEEDEDGESD